MASDRATRIAAILQTALAPATVVVEDESARHAGHAGAAPGGQTHFAVRVVTPAFQGLGRIARSRRVHELLGAEFAGGLHALSLVLRTPEEQAAADAASTLA